MNISSIIIKIKEYNMDYCKEQLKKISGVEVSIIEGDTIIAVIEAKDTNEEIKILKEIECTEGVLSAAMHYTYFEDELRDEIKNMQKDVPHILNDDTIPIDKVRYSGSINSMMKK